RPPPPTPTPLPYTPLFRSRPAAARERAPGAAAPPPRRRPDRLVPPEPRGLRLHSRAHPALPGGVQLARRDPLDRVAGRSPLERQDRKSTRLNSSHQITSYA